jgi:hypothetical protein
MIRNIAVGILSACCFVSVAQGVCASTTSLHFGFINQAETLPSPKIIDGKILAQDNNVISFSFVLANGPFEWADTWYGIILRDTQSGDVVDVSVAEQPLSVGASEYISVEGVYNAPEYVNGTYEVSVEARSHTGDEFGTAVLGTVSISRDVSFRINTSTCLLVYDDEEYALEDDVVIPMEEQFSLQCKIVNIDDEIVVTPMLNTYPNSFFTSPVESRAGPIRRIPEGESEIIIPVLFPALSGKYVFRLSFKTEKGILYQTPIMGGYVLEGDKWRMTDARLDASAYHVDEQALVSLFVGGGARRILGTLTNEEVDPRSSIVVSIVSNGKSCVYPEHVPVERLMLSTDSFVDVPMMITAECGNPEVVMSFVPPDKTQSLTHVPVLIQENIFLWGFLFLMIVLGGVVLVWVRRTSVK